MSHTIYVGNVAKKRNSTFRPTLTEYFDVLLKSPTSLHTPTFTINNATFNYNYLKWDDRYYFVTDVVSRNNGIWEVSAVCDVLATYQDDILASTQFVSYSSHKTSIWLPDTRIPIQKDATVSSNSTAISLFYGTGFYALSAVGKEGCLLWNLTIGEVTQILDKISDWSDELIDAIMNADYPFNDQKHVYVGGNQGYDFTTIEKATESLAKMNNLVGFAGNAYADAPNCIRSCIYLPFDKTLFEGTQAHIQLGHSEVGTNVYTCKSFPVTGFDSVTIPWQFSDWRRAVCEDIYLYLPLVGMVSLPSDELINESSITINWSATATDGCVSYQVKAGSQTIGTYGANCAVNYALGISQQASAGEIVQTAFAGVEKMVSAGIQTASSLNPAGWVTGGIGIGIEGISAAYDTANIALSRHNSCIGGIGGGAGAGLSLDAQVFSVAHPTVISPDTMKDTMGLPTMKPMLLSSLTGYCQCANAHVAATGAEASELAEIDSYLNSGFYIETSTP